jgi:hypothetical protein
MGPEGDLVTGRMARGVRCFIVRIDGGLAGYGWLSAGPEWIGELQLEIKPREREGYIWNCVTLDAHRRQGVFRSLVTGMSMAGRRYGMRRMWIGSVAIPAERALGPTGFEPALRFESLTLAGVHLMRVKRASDGPLATDASNVVGAHPGLLIRASQRRRH